MLANGGYSAAGASGDRRPIAAIRLTLSRTLIVQSMLPLKGGVRREKPPSRNWICRHCSSDLGRPSYLELPMKSIIDTAGTLLLMGSLFAWFYFDWKIIRTKDIRYFFDGSAAGDGYFRSRWAQGALFLGMALS